ncbi:hypothetical protein ABZV34_20375 [Streptomyces sp. NPDC005195]|uniref:hypothetical protein n=1 Tax=Streptomyces sp. NPDC005195 TaxID=3154561 RepID=UPI0033A4954C
MRDLLERSTVARVRLQGELSGEPGDRKGLEAAGVSVVSVPRAGHTIMLDIPDAFVAGIAATV